LLGLMSRMVSQSRVFWMQCSGTKGIRKYQLAHWNVMSKGGENMLMLRKSVVTALVLILLAALVTGCTQPAAKGETQPQAKYKDGTYTAYSTADDKGYAWAQITIKDDKITDVKLKEFDAIGNEKNFATYSYAPAKTAN